jgi:NADP-dependent 3-hydroxy acid dehydrogenase YdfG
MAGETIRKTLVVGATGGMGSRAALQRAQHGDAIVLAGRNLSKLSEVAETISAEHEMPGVLTVDLGDMDACARCVAEAAEMMDGLDTLIYFSGVHVNARTQDADLSDWDQALDVNFRSFVHLVRAGIDPINASGQGAVIAVGSITTVYAGAGMNIATKQALTGFCQALFEDVREFGTKVSLIKPGYVATPMSASPRLASDLMIQPEDIAGAVDFILNSAPTACPTEIVIRPQRSPYK